MENMMKHFKLQPTIKEDTRRIMATRTVGPPSSKRLKSLYGASSFSLREVRPTPVNPFLKRGPPNAVVIPSRPRRWSSENMTELRLLEDTSRRHSTSDERYFNPPPLPVISSNLYGPTAHLQLNEGKGLWYDNDDDEEGGGGGGGGVGLRLDTSPALHPSTGASNTNNSNSTHRPSRSQCVSVIKMSPRIDHNGLSGFLQTKHASSQLSSEDKMLAADHTADHTELRAESKDIVLPLSTRDVSTQTEELSLGVPISSKSKETEILLPSKRNTSCQTETSQYASSEEEPRLIPLVTPAMYGIDPNSGNAVSLVFHFRVPAPAHSMHDSQNPTQSKP